MCCVRLERCRGTAEVAAAGVLPEGCWTLGAVDKLGVLALSKEVVLGIDLCAVECLMRCIFIIYSKLLGLGAARAAGVVLLLGTGVLLSIKQNCWGGSEPCCSMANR